MKESSSIASSAHHPALFLIQAGIVVDTTDVLVVFTRLEPISIIPEPIPAYFGL